MIIFRGCTCIHQVYVRQCFCVSIIQLTGFRFERRIWHSCCILPGFGSLTWVPTSTLQLLKHIGLCWTVLLVWHRGWSHTSNERVWRPSIVSHTLQPLQAEVCNDTWLCNCTLCPRFLVGTVWNPTLHLCTTSQIRKGQRAVCCWPTPMKQSAGYRTRDRKYRNSFKRQLN